MERKTKAIERHLHRLARRVSNGWSVFFYARFQAWNGERFEKRLSSDLQTARSLLRRYETLNDQRMWPLLLEEEVAVLEAARLEQEKASAMTISRFAEIYKELPEIKGKRSADRDAQLLRHIVRHLGPKLL